MEGGVISLSLISVSQDNVSALFAQKTKRLTDLSSTRSSHVLFFPFVSGLVMFSFSRGRNNEENQNFFLLLFMPFDA